MDTMKIVDLNVGGNCYVTTLSTILSCKDSLFHEMLNRNEFSTEKRIFIDRDGNLFKYILEYLRNKECLLPDNFQEKNRLITEATYYKLPSLVKILETKFSECIDKQKEVSKVSSTKGCIIISYRGSFQESKESQSDLKFRKITRILVSGRVQLCREVFGDTLNESRDPDHGTSDRYTSRYFLKHTFLEQAIDTLISANFTLKAAAASGTNSGGEKSVRYSENSVPSPIAAKNQDDKWSHYNEYIFIRE